MDERQRTRQAEGQEQLKGETADCERQKQGQRQGPTAAVSSRAWHQWRMKLRSCSTGGMELERFGLCLQAAMTSASGKTSEMLDLLKQMGVTASAEATRKPSKDLLPLPLTFSEEEKQWTEWASSEAPTSDKPWEAVRKAGRRAWLWLLIFSLCFLNCGALGSGMQPLQPASDEVEFFNSHCELLCCCYLQWLPSHGKGELACQPSAAVQRLPDLQVLQPASDDVELLISCYELLCC